VCKGDRFFGADNIGFEDLEILVGIYLGGCG
jgi:hypothetical protein